MPSFSLFLALSCQCLCACGHVLPSFRGGSTYGLCLPFGCAPFSRSAEYLRLKWIQSHHVSQISPCTLRPYSTELNTTVCVCRLEKPAYLHHLSQVSNAKTDCFNSAFIHLPVNIPV